MLNRLILSLGIGGAVLAPMRLVAATPLYRPFKSAYYLGRGDTGIATADNHEAIYYNPAGLALGKGIYKEVVLLSPQVTVSADTKELAKTVLIDKDESIDTFRKHIGKNQHVGLQNVTAIVFRRVALGFLSSADTDVLVFKDPNDGGLERLSARAAADQILSFSIAESIVNDSLYIGLTGKYLFLNRAALDMNVIDANKVIDDLKQDNILHKGRGSGADLGIIWKTSASKTQNISLGFTAENIGNISVVPTDESKPISPIKQSLNLGLAYEQSIYMSSFKLLSDFRDMSSNYDTRFGHKLFIGGEIDVKKIFGLTAGLYKGYTSFGTYLNLYVLRLDIGSYVEETGGSLGMRPDRRYFLRLMAGF